jgi:DNA-binding CsgD family transcriptional regulator
VAARALAFFATALVGSRAARPFPELTDREVEILQLIADGRGNLEIARQLHLADKTVRNHVSSVFAKLQVSDQPQAIVRARRAGLGSRRPGQGSLIRHEFTGQGSARAEGIAFHTWDIEVAADTGATSPRQAADLVIDNLELIARYTGKPAGDTTTITTATTDPQRGFTIDLEPTPSRSEPAPQRCPQMLSFPPKRSRAWSTDAWIPSTRHPAITVPRSAHSGASSPGRRAQLQQTERARGNRTQRSGSGAEDRPDHGLSDRPVLRASPGGHRVP